ncbi:hypothetical protein Droror1_Dr00000690 [Drosera rotundifolia]
MCKLVQGVEFVGCPAAARGVWFVVNLFRAWLRSLGVSSKLGSRLELEVERKLVSSFQRQRSGGKIDSTAWSPIEQEVATVFGSRRRRGCCGVWCGVTCDFAWFRGPSVEFVGCPAAACGVWFMANLFRAWLRSLGVSSKLGSPLELEVETKLVSNFQRQRSGGKIDSTAWSPIEQEVAAVFG